MINGKNYFKEVIQHYNGDNIVNSNMKLAITDVFCELFGDCDDYERIAVGHILTKATRCRSIHSFEKYLHQIIDFKKYPIELANYCAKFYA